MSSQPYRQLVTITDALTARLTQRYAAHLNCRSGCSHCCQHHLSVFPVEAAALSAAVRELPESTRLRLRQQAEDVSAREARGEPVACPMLIDDRCAVYHARPLICRTQGLPLLYEAADGQPEVDFCPLNFTADDAVGDLDEQNLVPLDALNLQLAAVNVSYCREDNLSPADRRISMAEIICGVKEDR